MAKDDEEISLDFSKITNFFKKKKKEKKEEHKEHHKIEEKEEEINIELESAWKYVKKHQIVFLILIAIILSIWLRAMPFYLPVTDVWAEDSVSNFYKNQIINEVNQKYPNLPEQNKKTIIEQEWKKTQQQQKSQLEQQKKQTSESFKQQFKDEDGQTYLLAIDPYQAYRRAKNIIDHGHVGDTLKDGKPYNTHKMAPIGEPMTPEFHDYAIVYTYKIIHLISPSTSLLTATFYVPLIFAALCVIPAFFIARRIAGNFGGFFAALIVAIHPAFLTRTAAGFADTDAYNVFFPLMITWFFIEAFSATELKKKIIYSVLCSLFVALFAFTWTGWWFSFYIIIATIAAYLGYIVIKRLKQHKLKGFFKAKDIRNFFLMSAAFIGLSYIFLVIITGRFGVFADAVHEVIKRLSLKVAAHASLWPNVFTTVAELNPAGLDTIINNMSMGSSILIFIGFMGLIFAMIPKERKQKELRFIIASAVWYVIMLFLIKPLSSTPLFYAILIGLPVAVKIIMALWKNEEIEIKYSILLAIWFIGTIYASTKGVRFIMLLVPAFAVSAGIAVGYLYGIIITHVTKAFDLNKTATKTVLIILALLLLLGPVKGAVNTAKNEIPSMNDQWYETLSKIRLESEPNAIINSWWDFGHWFKAIGDRAVTFDGASQNTPMAHWIGKTLLTDDEEIAVGILRMLDCGSNTAFNALNAKLNNTVKSVEILNEVILLDTKEEAKTALLKYVDDTTAENVSTRTHCSPPENYFITSSDMVGKAAVWGHFGSWDFKKAAIWTNAKKMEFNDMEYIKNLGYTKEEANKLYTQLLTLNSEEKANTWISPWPGFLSNIGSCINTGKELQCENMVIDSNLKATIKTQQGDVVAKKVSIVTPNRELVVIEHNSTSNIGVALIPSGQNPRYILMNDQLVGSMFVRLYFYRGHGLKYFDPFDEKIQVTGGQIFTWKIDWKGETPNDPYKITEAEENATNINNNTSV